MKDWPAVLLNRRLIFLALILLLAACQTGQPAADMVPTAAATTILPAVTTAVAATAVPQPRLTAVPTAAPGEESNAAGGAPSGDSASGDSASGDSASGSKQAFCVQSTSRYSNHELSPLVHDYSCRFQGLQVSWVDEYDAGLDAQWIDVTGLAITGEEQTGELIFRGWSSFRPLVAQTVSLRRTN